MASLHPQKNRPPVPAALLALILAAAGSPGPAGEPAVASATDLGARPPGGENLFRGPARCVLGYLEAVRLAGPRGPVLARQRRPREEDYRAARERIAPRALAEIDRLRGGGEDHPLASWRAAARGLVLESFSLLEVRRAPRGTAVVTVRERWRQDGSSALGVTVSEFLVARVGGDWKVVDRHTGRPFQEQEIEGGYAGWFDEPGSGER